MGAYLSEQVRSLWCIPRLFVGLRMWLTQGISELNYNCFYLRDYDFLHFFIDRRKNLWKVLYAQACFSKPYITRERFRGLISPVTLDYKLRPNLRMISNIVLNLSFNNNL